MVVPISELRACLDCLGAAGCQGCKRRPHFSHAAGRLAAFAEVSCGRCPLWILRLVHKGLQCAVKTIRDRPDKQGKTPVRAADKCSLARGKSKPRNQKLNLM